jgi:hypothetical protein
MYMDSYRPSHLQFHPVYRKIRVADEEIKSKNPVRKTRGALIKEERENALKTKGPSGAQFKAAMRKGNQTRGR